MNILIVSIDHRVQLIKSEYAKPALNERRDRLENLLQKKVAERDVQFIGEESLPQTPTIAQRLARTHNPQIPWVNIDMTDEERKLAGIHDALHNRPAHTEKRGEDTVLIEHRIPDDNVREDFMVSRAIQNARNSESILILCGDMYVHALKQKFEERGHSVDIDESLITEKNWADASSPRNATATL